MSQHYLSVSARGPTIFEELLRVLRDGGNRTGALNGVRRRRSIG